MELSGSLAFGSVHAPINDVLRIRAVDANVREKWTTTNDLSRILYDFSDVTGFIWWTISDEEYETILSSLYPVLRVVGPLLVDDDIYYEGIDYDYYYSKIAEDYLLTDEEMGEKYGSSAGFDGGYDSALYGYEYDDTPDLETPVIDFGLKALTRTA